MCTRDRHLELDTAPSGHGAPDWPETCFHRVYPSSSFPLLSSTTTDGDIVNPSPLGLVPHTRTATPIASRLHRLYEAVEMERVQTTKTTSTNRQPPEREIESTATMNAPRLQTRRKLSGGSYIHPRSPMDTDRHGTKSRFRRLNERQHRNMQIVHASTHPPTPNPGSCPCQWRCARSIY